jgi:hypothetical protein
MTLPLPSMEVHFLSFELTSPYMSLSFCIRAACSADGCLGFGGLSSRRWEDEEDEDEVDARGGDLQERVYKMGGEVRDTIQTE